jgi:hypothetical protein
VLDTEILPLAPAQGWGCGHCQVNEKSLSDAFPSRKAEGLRRAKILEIVKAQNLL